MWLTAWWGCTGSGELGCKSCDTPASTDAGTTDTGAVVPPPTTTVPPPTPTPTTTTPTTPACAESPTLSIVDATAEPGAIGVQERFHLVTSEPAEVAVRCVDEGDAAEVFLVEGSEGTDHDLLLSGLLPGRNYRCEAVPTCPTAGDPPVDLSFSTPEGPEPIPEVDVTVDAALGMTGTWTLLSFKDNACGFSGPWLVAYDPIGRPRWWKQLPDEGWIDVEALWHPEDDTIVWGGGFSSEGRPHVDAMSGDTRYASDLLPGALSGTFHHDGKRLADGRILSLEVDENRDGGDTWAGFRVRAHDPATGTVSVDVRSQRYVDEGALRTAGGWDQDPYHANWMDLVPDPAGGADERLYVSLCFDHRILAIDAATGDLRWSLAQDEGWTVQDGAGSALPQSMLPECQHGLEVVGDDVLLVYDNGQDRRRSQITELHVDPVAQVVTIPFRWTDDWFEDTLGDVDDLGNGRILVTQAHPECWSPSRGARSAVLEVDRATGAVASRVEFPDTQHTTYRAQRYAGCEFLPGTRYCDDTLARLSVLAPIFDP